MNINIAIHSPISNNKYPLVLVTFTVYTPNFLALQETVTLSNNRILTAPSSHIAAANGFIHCMHGNSSDQEIS